MLTTPSEIAADEIFVVKGPVDQHRAGIRGEKRYTKIWEALETTPTNQWLEVETDCHATARRIQSCAATTRKARTRIKDNIIWLQRREKRNA